MDDGKVVWNHWTPLSPDETRSNGTWKLEGNIITMIFSGEVDGETFKNGAGCVIKSIESSRMVLSMGFHDPESGAPYADDGSEGVETVLERE